MGTLHPFYEEELEHVTWAGDTNQGVAFKTQLLMAQLQPVTEAPCMTDVQECGAPSCCYPAGDVPQAELLSRVGLCARWGAQLCPWDPEASVAEGWRLTTGCCWHFASSAPGAVTVADGQGRGVRLLSSLPALGQRSTAGTCCARWLLCRIPPGRTWSWELLPG